MSTFRAYGLAKGLAEGRAEDREEARLGLAERTLQAQIEDHQASRDIQRLQFDFQRTQAVGNLVKTQEDELLANAEAAVAAGNGPQLLQWLASDGGNQVLSKVESAAASIGQQSTLRNRLALKLGTVATPDQVATNKANEAGQVTGATKRAGLAPDIVRGEARAAGASAAAQEAGRFNAVPTGALAAREGAIAGARDAAQTGEDERLLRLYRAAEAEGDKEGSAFYKGRMAARQSSQTFDPRLQQRIEQGAREGEAAGAANLSRLGSLLGQVRENPGVAGARGGLAETVGGWLGQITSMVNESAGQSVEEGIASFFADATPEEVNRFRVEARAQVSAMLPAITNENSRFSDAERKLARETARVLEAEASAVQVVGALKTMLRLEMAGRIRADQTRAQFGANKLDIVNNKADRVRIARDMVRLGLSQKEAADFVEERVSELQLVK